MGLKARLCFCTGVDRAACAEAESEAELAVELIGREFKADDDADGAEETPLLIAEDDADRVEEVPLLTAEDDADGAEEVDVPLLVKFAGRSCTADDGIILLFVMVAIHAGETLTPMPFIMSVVLSCPPTTTVIVH